MTRQCETALKKQILQSRIIKSKTPILDGINFMRDELEQDDSESDDKK